MVVGKGRRVRAGAAGEHVGAGPARKHVRVVAARERVVPVRPRVERVEEESAQADVPGQAVVTTETHDGVVATGSGQAVGGVVPHEDVSLWASDELLHLPADYVAGAILLVAVDRSADAGHDRAGVVGVGHRVGPAVASLEPIRAGPAVERQRARTGTKDVRASLAEQAPEEGDAVVEHANRVVLIACRDLDDHAPPGIRG